MPPVRSVRGTGGIPIGGEEAQRFGVGFGDGGRSYGTENPFTAALGADPGELVLTEGQRVDWFLEYQTARRQLAYEDNAVVVEFLPPT